MSKHIKQFQNESEYETFKSSAEFVTPNLSWCVEENSIKYNAYVVPAPQHEYVEIGGVKWATMNVGAETIGDYGNYYMYGKGSDDYFATSGESIYQGQENPLASSADTATQLWGGNWRMPTSDEFASLLENTEREYMEIGDVIGYKFVDSSDSSKYIFLPLAGYYYHFGTEVSSLEGLNYYGHYLSSTPDSENPEEAFGLFIDDTEGGYSYLQNHIRAAGYPIRPVLDE